MPRITQVRLVQMVSTCDEALNCPAAPSTGVPAVRCGPATLAVLPTRLLSWADEQGVLRGVVQKGRTRATYAVLVVRRPILIAADWHQAKSSSACNAERARAAERR